MTSARARIAGAMLVVAGVLGASVATAGVASAAIEGGPTIAPAQSYTWEWTDGSTSTRRTFYRSDYGGVESALPGLRAMVRPIYPQRTVKLQYWDPSPGRWRTEDGPEYTNSQTGNAVLRLNANNCSGRWCNGTYKYRLMAASNYKALKITFIRD
jgi:hypothetical protein